MFLHDSTWKIKLAHSCFKFDIFGQNFEFCTWIWLFGLHDKFISFSIKSSQIFMKHNDHAKSISKFTFDILDCLKKNSYLSYLHVTLHLPQPLTDGEVSKDDKMSSIHPNSNLSDVMGSICQGEHVKKINFEILSLTNCNTKNLILLSTKVYKLQYISFYSIDFKYEDRFRNLSRNIIYCEKPILIFWVLHL